MTAYVYDPTRPYPAYLQQGPAAEDVALSPEAAALIGTAEPGAVGGGPESQSSRPVFHWGRSEQLLAAKSFNLPLSQLKHSAGNTAEMWALEQFDAARDAFNRGVPQEALAHVERAIQGDGQHPGHAADHRFHLLLGVLRLGSFSQFDPAVLNPGEAIVAFTTAGRYAKSESTSESAQVFFAAGWACYVQGRSEEALMHTSQALVLDSTIPEIHFQAAKILMHLKEPESARPHLARAIDLEPAFAAEALRDGDFVPFGELVLEVVGTEREDVQRRASQRLQRVTQRAIELGLIAPVMLPGQTPATPPVLVDPQELGPVLASLEAARAAFDEGSLCSFHRAVTHATRAEDAINFAVARVRKIRQLAEDAMHTADEQAAEIAGIQIGAYRLNAVAIGEFNCATALLQQARQAAAANTLPGNIEAERLAQRAIVALNQTLERYKNSALEQALAEFDELQREIDARQEQQSSQGNPAKTFAAIGAAMAILPGGCLGLNSYRTNTDFDWPNWLFRCLVSVVACAGVGALLGALLGPIFSSSSGTADPKLDARKTALKQTIGALRAFSPSRRGGLS